MLTATLALPLPRVIATCWPCNVNSLECELRRYTNQRNAKLRVSCDSLVRRLMLVPTIRAFWHFLEVLRRKQSLNDVIITQIPAGQSSPVQCGKYKAIIDRLMTVVGD